MSVELIEYGPPNPSGMAQIAMLKMKPSRYVALLAKPKTSARPNNVSSTIVM
jgi:hypothetical protein